MKSIIFMFYLINYNFKFLLLKIKFHATLQEMKPFRDSKTLKRMKNNVSTLYLRSSNQSEAYSSNARGCCERKSALRVYVVCQWSDRYQWWKPAFLFYFESNTSKQFQQTRNHFVYFPQIVINFTMWGKQTTKHEIYEDLFRWRSPLGNGLYDDK